MDLSTGSGKYACVVTYILEIHQRYTESLASFNRVIELEPFHTDGYIGRGFALNKLQRYNEAIESLDRAIELDAGDILAFYNRAQSFLATGRWSEFLIDLRRTLQGKDAEYYEQWSYTSSYIQTLLESSSVQVWSKRIATIIECYAEHDALKWLGQGLTESLSGPLATGKNFEDTDAWNAAWQGAGTGYADLEIPLRLLGAVVQWHRRPDRRILLRLPVEERKVLEEVLSAQ